MDATSKVEAPGSRFVAAWRAAPGTPGISASPTGEASRIARVALVCTWVALLIPAIGGAPASAQNVAQLTRDEEVRLAMSAGPLAVSRDAAVYVLGETGFVQEIRGTNGFACMVIRSADDPDLVAPHCFSPDAVETVLPAKLEEGRLQMAGHTQEEVDRTLLEGFETGSLALPEGNAYAYMLSAGQQLGPAGKWKPHFMMYLPWATNEQIGGSPEETAFPFVGPVVNHPHSTMVIVMTEFVDPADVVLRR